MTFFPQFYFIPDTIVSGYVETQDSSPDRIYAQYKNKPKAVAWYKITLSLATQIANTSLAVRVMYDIDTSYGEQLNVIGRIVGVSRDFLGYVPLNPGLFADPDGDQFGDDSAMFSNLSIDQDEQMSDELYRLAIRSKIVKNNSYTTIDDILTSVNFLLPGAEVIRLTDGEDMSFSVEFYGQISELERWALLNADLIPKPQGVRFNGFLEAFEYVQFDDNQIQFGDTDSQFTGFVGV